MSSNENKGDLMNPLLTDLFRSNFTTPEKRQASIQHLHDLTSCNKRSDSIRHSITLMHAAEIYLKPAELYDYIIGIMSFLSPDENAFNIASGILRNLFNNKGLDLKTKILNFEPKSHYKTMVRGVLIECMEFPPCKEYYKFIFESSLSNVSLVRRCFLRFANSLKNVEIDKDLREKIEEMLLHFAGDSSYLVIKEWFDPAFYFLKNNSGFPNVLKKLLRSCRDNKIRVLIGLNFERVYPICHEAVSLFKDQDIMVIAAAISGIGNLNIKDLSIKQALLNENTIIRCLTIKNMQNLPEDIIDEYMKDTNAETRTSLIQYFQNHINSEKYIKMLFNFYNQKDDDFSWRICIELLSFKPEVLLSFGDIVFDFAVKCSSRHPPKLMRKALEIIDYFARSNSVYCQKAELILSRLKSSNSVYQQKAGNILLNLKMK